MQPRAQLFGRLSGGFSIHPCSVCTRTRCCAVKPAGCRPSWCVHATLGAPRFPATLEAVDQIQSVVEIAEDFETQSSWLTHVQIERALGSATAFAVAYAHTAGRHLPVLVDENLIATGPILADGRPTYSEAVSPATRVDPLYDHIDVVRSIARSSYDAVILTFRTRWRDNISLQASYTGARARDNGPLTNAYVQGSQEDRASDPSNLDRDYGPTPFDQPHAFVLSGLVRARRLAHRRLGDAGEEHYRWA